MIPIRDTLRTGTRPVVVYSIVTANVLVYFYVNLGLSARALHAFFLQYGIVPIRYSNPDLAAHFGLLEQALPFLTSMFLHGGVLHLLFNMWTLVIFGDNIEDWFGHGGFLLFYLYCGVASGLLHLWTNWGSELPTIGASGAIAGVMGAYFLLFPKARILTLVPIFIFLQFLELPAFVFLGFWFLLQFLSGTAAGAGGGVAWWAHVGGFVAGAAVVFIFGGGSPARPSRTRATLPSPRRRGYGGW